jgi:hypothetical protein
MAKKRHEELFDVFSEPIHDSETIQRRREEARKAKEQRRYRRYIGASAVAGGLAVYLFLGGGLRAIGLKAEREYHRLQNEPTCSGSQTIPVKHPQTVEALKHSNIITSKDFNDWDKVKVVIHRSILINHEPVEKRLENAVNAYPGDEATMPTRCED